MNNNSQKKADFDGFVFKKDDESNLFDQANQAANSQIPAAATPFVMGSTPVTTPVASQEAKIPMSLDVNAFIQGFADVEQGSARRCVNPYLSAVRSASVMDPVPPQSVNPYIDHLAQMQQFNGMANVSMQEDVNVFPNQPQDGNQFYQPAGMIAQPGFVSNTPQMISPYMNPKTAKKKGVKATAYDIMINFINRIPMFTHKLEVYIYDQVSGAYKKEHRTRLSKSLWLSTVTLSERAAAVR